MMEEKLGERFMIQGTYFKVRTFFFINFKSVLPFWTILIRNLLLHRILSAVNFQLHFQ